MKKQQKQLVLLLIVLVVLVGGYFGLRYYNENAVTETPAEEKEYIVEIEEGSVQRISYSYNEEEFAFYKDGENWIYEADTSLDISEYYLNLMVGKCENLVIKEKIENVTDMSQYGLDVPARYISFETEEETYTLNVGDRNQISYGYYVNVPGEDTVYLVENLVVTSFSKTLEDLVEEEEAEESEAE